MAIQGVNVLYKVRYAVRCKHLFMLRVGIERYLWCDVTENF